MLPCQPLLLVVGVTLLDRSSFDIRKSKWSEASGQYLFWKAKNKDIPKTEFSSHIKTGILLSMIIHLFYHYAQ
jgi:hypothetical protein